MKCRRAILLAALCLCASSWIAARGIARAQGGPSWEVPAAAVSSLATGQYFCFFLTAAALVAGVAGLTWSRRRVGVALLLSTQAVIGLSLTLLASPGVAAQWPSDNGALSEAARFAPWPALAVSATFGGAAVLLARARHDEGYA